MDRTLKIFIASPADLAEERSCVRQVVERINATIGQHLHIFLQVLSWELNVHPGIGEDAQDVINKQIQDAYDIFIGLMWSRAGTQTKRALSGTIEEYERAYRKHLLHPEVQLMMYFKTEAIPIEHLDLSQLEVLQTFKQRVADDGNLYYTYQTLSEFSEMLHDHLTMILMDYPKVAAKTEHVKDYIINSDHRPLITKQKQAVALAMVRKHSVLIVRRSKKLRIGAGLWQMPGGKVERNESPSAAVLREVKEELGIELNPDRLEMVTTMDAHSLGDAEDVLIKMHLFYYDIQEESFNARLEDSIDSVKWFSFSKLYGSNLGFLGDTEDILQLAKRYKYAYLPLRALQEYIAISQGASLPRKLSGYSEEASQMLMTILDVLGLINAVGAKNNIKKESTALFSVLLEWCLTNRSVFEADGSSDWQTNILLLNNGDKLLQYQKTLFERHESLSALMSFKLSKVVSHRNVCDILIFRRVQNKLYILLRWDYFAEKYQIPAKGLENSPFAENSYDERNAQFVIAERFSKDIVSAFTYQHFGDFSTTHLGSGSIDHVKFVRDYNVSLFLLQIKKQEAKRVLSTITAVNKRASLIMRDADVSKGVKQHIASFHWAELDEIMKERYTYRNKKLQGFSEIVDYIGEESMIALAQKYAEDLMAG